MNKPNQRKEPKSLKELTLLDRFLFAEAAERREFMEPLLQIILGKPLLLKDPPQAEKEKRGTTWNKQIRLDVWSVDQEDAVYDADQELVELLRYFERTTEDQAARSGSEKIQAMHRVVE